MTWLPWSLLAIVSAFAALEAWAGRFWYREAMELRQQRDALAAELAVWTTKRGKS
jgi:hypothetical protein